MNLETADGSERGEGLSVRDLMNFSRRIRTESDEARKYFTYALLLGSLKVGKVMPQIFFVSSDFMTYGGAFGVSKYMITHIEHFERLINRIDTSDTSEITSYSPRFEMTDKIIDYLSKSRMPDVILECGITTYEDEVKKYMVVHHTRDISTIGAIKEIQELISSTGISGS